MKTWSTEFMINSFKTTTDIDFLQRWILVASLIYYELNESMVDDKIYDQIAYKLVDLHKAHGDVSDTQYGYVFYDFDGTTGFDLFYRLNDEDKDRIRHIAYSVVRNLKAERTHKSIKKGR